MTEDYIATYFFLIKNILILQNPSLRQEKNLNLRKKKFFSSREY
jgi:hypothetical protein